MPKFLTGMFLAWSCVVASGEATSNLSGFATEGAPMIPRSYGQAPAAAAAPAAPKEPSVFDLEKPSAAPRGGRYSGGEPDYNSAQREEWIAACEGEKKRSMEDFRRCYNDRKKRSAGDLRRRFDAVERRMGAPRDTNPAGPEVVESTPPPQPAPVVQAAPEQAPLPAADDPFRVLNRAPSSAPSADDAPAYEPAPRGAGTAVDAVPPEEVAAPSSSGTTSKQDLDKLIEPETN